MKLRNAFVSNSSSSSFIIEILDKTNEPCPTCGRSDPDLLRLLGEGNVNDWWNSATRVDNDKQGIIQEHLDEATSYKEDLDKLEGLKDSDRCPLTTWRESTVGESRKWRSEQLASVTAFIKEIEELTSEVYEISIDYEDQVTMNAVGNMEQNGKLKIIRGDI